MSKHRYTIKDIEAIVNSDASFEEYIEGIHSLRGQTLDLMRDVMTVGYELDGEEFSDEAMFTLMKDVMDAYMHYEATHKGESK